MTLKSKSPQTLVEDFMGNLKLRNPNEPEFHQAVEEMAEVILPFIQENKKYQNQALLERLSEPDRTISFRVTWVDDNGRIRVNKGFRVQFSQAIGPYKGGLRFHPSVNPSILKFLGFEQIFKNSLTTLPLGGGKGGADFDPKGKSEGEVMRFCQAFMSELFRYIGPAVDAPAGDIGVGTREIGYMFGMYKKLRNQHEGVLTGKGLHYGGSQIRTEATGYGNVYFMEEMLKFRNDSVAGKRCVVSGSGNVAQYTIEKLLDLGASVHAVSDSKGMVFDKNGIDEEKLEYIKDLKNNRRGRIEEFAERYGLVYQPAGHPWNIKCDLAFPCATQNELNEADARVLVANGCAGVGEGANMPCTSAAIEVFQNNKICFAPGKAANAGGVATSGLEMSQNSQHIVWTRDEVDKRLHSIMRDIHDKCIAYGKVSDHYVDYVKGANIAGFVKVADAIIEQGVT